MGVLIIAGVLAGLFAAGFVRAHTQGRAAVYGAKEKTHSGPTTVSILPGLPGISFGGDPLYAKNDPWLAYLADERTCPGGEQLDAPLVQQAETMVCLVNYARRKRGLGPVPAVTLLDQSSLAKAQRIARCADFDHDACGEDAASDAART